MLLAHTKCIAVNRSCSSREVNERYARTLHRRSRFACPLRHRSLPSFRFSNCAVGIARSFEDDDDVRRKDGRVEDVPWWKILTVLKVFAATAKSSHARNEPSAGYRRPLSAKSSSFRNNSQFSKHSRLLVYLSHTQTGRTNQASRLWQNLRGSGR